MMEFQPYLELFPEDEEPIPILIIQGESKHPQSAFGYVELYCVEQNCNCSHALIGLCAENGEQGPAFIHVDLNENSQEASHFLDPATQSDEAQRLTLLFREDLKERPLLLETFYQHYREVRQAANAPLNNRPAAFQDQQNFTMRLQSQATPTQNGIYPLNSYRFEECPVSRSPLLMISDPLDSLAKFPPFIRKHALKIKTSFKNLEKRNSLLKIAHQLIKRIELRAERERFPIFDAYCEMKLNLNPNIVFCLLDCLAHYYHPDSESAMSAYKASSILFTASLSRIHFAVNRGRPWAIRISERIQMQIVNRFFVPEVEQTLQHDILDALSDSHLPLISELKKAHQGLIEYYNRFVGRRGLPDIDVILREIQEDGYEDLFEVAEIFFPQILIMPTLENQTMILEFLAPHPMLREIIPIALLLPDLELRMRIPAILAARATPKAMTPVMLRRMIMLRNWLTEKERPALDGVIRKARLARVPCAPMEKKKTIKTYASLADGSGCQGIWIVIKNRSTWTIAHILVQIHYGIRDTWCRDVPDLQEIKQELSLLEDRETFQPIQTPFLDVLINHFIWEGHLRERLPPFILLRIAELASKANWGPSSLFGEETIKQLFLESGLGELDTLAFDRILFRSHVWAQKHALSHSWFEDDNMVDETLADEFGAPDHWIRSMEVAIDLIILKILEPRRSFWQHHFLWSALLFKNHKPKPKMIWRKYLALSAAIQQGRSLNMIPIIRKIAAQTVEAAYLRSRKEF